MMTWDEDADEDDDWAGDDLPQLPFSKLRTRNSKLLKPPLETRNLELETRPCSRSFLPTCEHSNANPGN